MGLSLLYLYSKPEISWCVCVCVRFEPVPRLRRFLVGGSGLMSSMHLVRRQISPEGPGQHGHRGTAGHVEERAERMREGGRGGGALMTMSSVRKPKRRSF